jgi:hypothetical protein
LIPHKQWLANIYRYGYKEKETHGRNGSSGSKKKNVWQKKQGTDFGVGNLLELGPCVWLRKQRSENLLALRYWS